MSPLPLRDMWRHRCTLRRPKRTTNAEFQVVEEYTELLVDEPCAMANKNRQVLTPNGIVWKTAPRLSVSPLDPANRPLTHDLVTVDVVGYRVTDVVEVTDYDGSYLGSLCNLLEVGVTSAAN